MYLKLIRTWDASDLKNRKFGKYETRGLESCIVRAARKSEKDNKPYFVTGGGTYSNRYSVTEFQPGFSTGYNKVTGWQVEYYGPDQVRIQADKSAAEFEKLVLYYTQRYNRPVPVLPTCDPTITALSDRVITLARKYETANDPVYSRLLGELKAAYRAWAEKPLLTQIETEYRSQCEDFNESASEIASPDSYTALTAYWQDVRYPARQTATIDNTAADLVRLAAKCKKYGKADTKPNALAENLYRAVSVASLAVSDRPSMPILGTVHVESIDNTTLRVTGTNLEMAFSTTCGYTGPYVDTCIPTKALLESLAVLAESNDTNAIHLMQWARPNLERGQTAYTPVLSLFGTHQRLTLYCQPAAEFPTPLYGDLETVAVAPSGKAFAKDLAGACKAVAKEDNRPILTGVNFALSGESMTLTAADGYKVARFTPVAEVVKETAFIVPGIPLARLAALLSDNPVTIAASAKVVQFTCGDITLTVCKIDGTYPDMEAIKPTVFKATATLFLDDLIGAVKGVKLFADKAGKLRPVTLDAGSSDASLKYSSLTLKAHSHENGDRETTVNGSIDAPISVCLDAVQLYDVLTDLAKQTKKPTKAELKKDNAARTVTLSFGTTGSVLIDHEGHQTVIHENTQVKPAAAQS